MHITHSALQMQSNHSYLEYQQQHESMTLWRSSPRGVEQRHVENSSERLLVSVGQQGLQQHPVPVMPSPVVLPVTEDLIQPMMRVLPPDPASINAANETEQKVDNVEDLLDLKLVMLKRFIEALTGRRMELFDPAELEHESENLDIPSARQTATPNQAWGMSYQFQRSHVEMEQSHFTAQGIVHTADGREIHFDLQLLMSREYIEHQQLRIEVGETRLKDPLVINFNGHSAQLTQTRFAFDLDANGVLNEIHFVGPNSGFLALDSNGDGIINDGSELFGALSGDGFAELASHDEDRNGWIDANDAVFSRLLIWSRDTDGSDHLDSLADRRIGAIYLGHTATPFSLKDEQNQLQGQIRSSGIYLGVDGQIESVQQLDLVV